MYTQLLYICACTHVYGACEYTSPAASLMINSLAALSFSLFLSFTLSLFFFSLPLCLPLSHVHEQTDIYGYLYDRISRMILQGLLNDGAFATGLSCHGHVAYAAAAVVVVFLRHSRTISQSAVLLRLPSLRSYEERFSPHRLLLLPSPAALSQFRNYKSAGLKRTNARLLLMPTGCG